MNIRSLLLTGMVHAIPALVFLSCKSPPPPTEIKENPSLSEEVVFVSISDSGTAQCTNSYTGLGVMAGNDGTIWTVAPNSPAEKAGIQEGDVVQELLNIWPGLFPKGHVLKLHGLRNNRPVSFTVVIGDVCYA